MSDPERPRARADVVLRDLGGEAMLYDPAKDQVVRLNGTARRIWTLCDGAHDAADIAARVSAETHPRVDVNVRADVENTVRAFARAGLLS